MPFDRDKVKRAVGRLAEQGIYVGTSSWKYAGWRGMLYDESRYVWHGRLSESRFEKLCLAEYAEVFKTVSVDAAYYKFPDRSYLEGLVAQVPGDFRFALKVTDEITIKKFTRLPRFGPRAGKANGNFLNADLFVSDFLAPCEPFRQSIGLLMFQFSHFYTEDFARGRDFVEALGDFLAKLPTGWPYGVEIRNRYFLKPEYFGTLARHGVVHIFNSWADMPPVDEQFGLPGSRTHPDLLSARFQLRPGRKYEDAVKLFRPYDRVKDPYPEGRAAASKLIREGLRTGKKTRTFIYVNNRFEGNALETIDAALDEVVEG
ncbi:MAG TPA: DUF72 domain-containing protein [Verrucomicrobiae bacterium]|nr:DUF72 domain-containing protein [Verrucomicrobiae bacterium]